MLKEHGHVLVGTKTASRKTKIPSIGYVTCGASHYVPQFDLTSLSISFFPLISNVTFNISHDMDLYS